MHYLLGLLLLGGAVFLQAQGSNLPLGNPAYHTLDRLEILSGIRPTFHATLKYYTRGDAVRYAEQVDTGFAQLSKLDRWDLDYIYRDNNEWLSSTALPLPLADRRDSCCYGLSQIERARASAHWEESRRPLWRKFYQTPANLLDVNRPAFHLRLNPLLNLQYGPVRGSDQPYFFNQRGAEVRGGIDDRIYFYFQLQETQAQLPDYVRDYVQAYRTLPGAGFFKPYNSEIFNINEGYDFLNAQGYLAFSISPHVGAQFGYGRNFIGNGWRSMLLSDFANNYLYLRLNWRVWKFHYQNIFAELATQSRADLPAGDALLGKKYMATHHLSIDIGQQLNVGIFESVIFARPNQFELQYLNPVILYRAVEQAVGSPDNVLVGADFRWNLFRRTQLYGQLLLDEFFFRELFIERRGWWANKVATQVGVKYINALGVDHLDLQAEYNVARPYTYSHRDSTGSYAHYNQALAHPLGANFREWMVRAQYRPVARLWVEGRLLYMQQGRDQDGQNYGANILLPHGTRVRDFGVDLLQGNATNTTLLSAQVSYMLRHNFWLDARLLWRSAKRSDPAEQERTTLLHLGVRWNVAREDFSF